MLKILIALIAMATPLSITGCQKKAASSDSQHGFELFYYKQENQEGFKRLVDAFTKDNPTIKVQLLIIPNDGDAAMSARAAQNKLPALMQLQTYSKISEYAKKGYLVDLTNIEAVQNVLPSSLSSVSYNGKVFALPMDYSGIGLLCNKTVFKKLGLEPPKNFSELVDVCNACKQEGVAPFAGLLKENWSAGHFITMLHTALLAQNVNIDNALEMNKYFDDFIDKMNISKTHYDRNIDSEKLFEVMDFYRENMNTNAAEMLGGDQQRSFAQGDSAMMVQGLWSYVDAKKLNSGLEVDFVPFPIFDEDDKNKFYADVDSCFAITTQVDAAAQQDAITFLNWLSSKGRDIWVSEYKLTHSFKEGDFSVLGAPYEALMENIKENGAYPWLFSRYPSIVFEDACKNGAQQYLLKFATKEKVIEDIDRQWKDSRDLVPNN